MANEIFGCFQTKEEVIQAVNLLSLKGFPADRIKIFTSQSDPKELTRETDGFVVHVKDDIPKRASAYNRFVHKISDCDKEVQDKLLDNGLSEHQAEKYANNISDGDMLVVADNKLKMGHTRATEEFSMESPFVNLNKH